MEKQKITVRIVERNYTLNIQPELEEPLRAAVALLNKRIDEFRAGYNKDLVDVLSVVLLNEEYRLVEAIRRNSGELKVLQDEISSLDAQLDEYLGR